MSVRQVTWTDVIDNGTVGYLMYGHEDVYHKSVICLTSKRNNNGTMMDAVDHVAVEHFRCVADGFGSFFSKERQAGSRLSKTNHGASWTNLDVKAGNQRKNCRRT